MGKFTEPGDIFRSTGMLITLLTLAVALVPGQSKDSTTPLFSPPVSYGSGGLGAVAMAVADVNADGKTDVVVVNIWDSKVGVLLGNGDGSFKTAITYDSGGLFAGPLGVADLNRDGKLDLVVGNECASGELHCGTAVATDSTLGVFLGNGDGTFEPAVLYDSGGQGTSSLIVADVNGDGKLDLVTGNLDARNNGNNRISVLLGNGDGSFQAAKTQSSGGCGFETGAAAVADVNGDGKADLLAVSANGDNPSCGNGQVIALSGNGNGTFEPVASYDSGGPLLSSVELADVNRDGKPDLLVSNLCSNGCTGDGTVGVLLGNGDGTFQPVVTYPSGGYASGTIAVADVNGDGNLDVAVANGCQGRCANGIVGLLLGNGDGTFQLAGTFDPVGGAESVAFADVNGDGGPDLLVANSWPINTPGTVDVLLNNTSFCTTPPVITVSVTPSFLWPPNGKMVPVSVSGTITDTGCTVTTAAYAVTDEYGEVQTTQSGHFTNYLV